VNPKTTNTFTLKIETHSNFRHEHIAAPLIDLNMTYLIPRPSGIRSTPHSGDVRGVPCAMWGALGPLSLASRTVLTPFRGCHPPSGSRAPRACGELVRSALKPRSFRVYPLHPNSPSEKCEGDPGGGCIIPRWGERDPDSI